jgi:anti-sigma factor (TIGR02949 family)
MSDPRFLDCEEVLRVIFAYLDGELEPIGRARVEAHLERCRGCFSRAEFERRLKRHMTGLASEPVSPAFERRVRTLIDGLVYPGSGEDHAPPAAHDA